MAMITPNLTDDERANLVRFLHEAIEADRYPFSPRALRLKALLEGRPVARAGRGAAEAAGRAQRRAGKEAEAVGANRKQCGAARTVSVSRNESMTYEVKDPILQILDHWQTLTAGILAVSAACLTVWATIRSANREISAAQKQTAVAQDQIDMTLRMERRRIARESYAFYMVLGAAMGIVIDDAAAA